MTKTFDCPLLYEDNTVSRINLAEEKSPIAVIVETPELPPFPFSLFQSEEALNIDRAEAYAAAYQTKGTRPGDWQMLSAEQMPAMPAPFREPCWHWKISRQKSTGDAITLPRAKVMTSTIWKR